MTVTMTMKTHGARANKVTWAGALSCLLCCASSVQSQSSTPLDRVQTAGLDSATVGRVAAYFASADRARATEMAALLERAAAHFQDEFGREFPLCLAVLQPPTWFDPYAGDFPAPYGMPWGWIPQSLIAVPASLSEGILIDGADEAANLRRVRFVMLHEYGHLAAKAYLHPEGEELWSPVRWFEEMLATYFAYAFLHQSDPEWARSGRQEWAAFIHRDPPPSATLDWRFMADLPPEEAGQAYAWYQNLLNLRAADVYANHGLGFLRNVRDALPWGNAGEWTTNTLISHLESFAPGFQLWADDLQQGLYPDGQPR